MLQILGTFKASQKAPPAPVGLPGEHTYTTKEKLEDDVAGFASFFLPKLNRVSREDRDDLFDDLLGVVKNTIKGKQSKPHQPFPDYNPQQYASHAYPMQFHQSPPTYPPVYQPSYTAPVLPSSHPQPLHRPNVPAAAGSAQQLQQIPQPQTPTHPAAPTLATLVTTPPSSATAHYMHLAEAMQAIPPVCQSGPTEPTHVPVSVTSAGLSTPPAPGSLMTSQPTSQPDALMMATASAGIPTCSSGEENVISTLSSSIY